MSAIWLDDRRDAVIGNRPPSRYLPVNYEDSARWGVWGSVQGKFLSDTELLELSPEELREEMT